MNEKITSRQEIADTALEAQIKLLSERSEAVAEKSDASATAELCDLTKALCKAAYIYLHC